jgi:disulfide bond formation protein DsbB
MTERSRLLFILIAIQAFIAFVGSLYFSNVLGFAPCDLCWYQRIAMYPQLFIAGAALIRKDVHAVWYGLPLAIAGLLVAVFQSTIYIIANYSATDVNIQCSVNSVSCTTEYLIFGIPVPFLSFAALAVTVIAYFLILKNEKSA